MINKRSMMILFTTFYYKLNKINSEKVKITIKQKDYNSHRSGVMIQLKHSRSAFNRYYNRRY